mmetsp:Transcript_12316/g.14316  ORF Transcript_12316/g.14316 Transcript_12316/m.14316 type:complete len:299 (+) Transcript_12316:139-1035(+)
MGSYQSIEKDVPDLSGKVIVITGGNSGIGFEAAKIFAQKNATVVLGCRNKERGEKAVADLLELHPNASVEFMPLELSSLAAIEKFVQLFDEKYDKLDILCNNAGLMALNERCETEDGFEMQWGVNVFGHFALTMQIMDKLERADEGGRIVNVASLVAFTCFGIDFNNLDSKQGYNKWSRYGETKLANIMFTHCLNRKLKEKGLEIEAVSCHPGYSATNLQKDTAAESTTAYVAQSSAMGALPTVMAALDPSLNGDEFVGPAALAWGYPIVHPETPAAWSVGAQEKLWSACEKATGLSL